MAESYSAFAIDLDGVVWRGEEILEGVPDALRALRDLGKPLLFLTNNATYLPEAVVKRLASAGIESAPAEVLTSAIVAREWMEHAGLRGANAFVLALDVVADQLHDVIRAVPVEQGNHADVVLVGRDLRFDFQRLHLASAAIRAGARFLALNRDATMPLETGLEPGTGAIVAAIEVASGVSPVVLGKPEMPMMSAAKKRLPDGDVLMVGDRAESDVAGARAIGWAAALVSTGVTGSSSVPDPAPDFFLRSLEDLHRAAD